MQQTKTQRDVKKSSEIEERRKPSSSRWRWYDVIFQPVHVHLITYQSVVAFNVVLCQGIVISRKQQNRKVAEVTRDGTYTETRMWAMTDMRSGRKQWMMAQNAKPFLKDVVMFVISTYLYPSLYFLHQACKARTPVNAMSLIEHTGSQRT